MIIRDPRDVVISEYNMRRDYYHEARVKGVALEDFVRERFEVRLMVAVLGLGGALGETCRARVTDNCTTANTTRPSSVFAAPFTSASMTPCRLLMQLSRREHFQAGTGLEAATVSESFICSSCAGALPSGDNVASSFAMTSPSARFLRQRARTTT